MYLCFTIPKRKKDQNIPRLLLHQAKYVETIKCIKIFLLHFQMVLTNSSKMSNCFIISRIGSSLCFYNSQRAYKIYIE